MRKILVFSILILILIGTNIFTVIVIKNSYQFISIGQIFMANIDAGERNRLFLQALISRLKENDPELVNKLKQIRGKLIYSAKGSNLVDLINQH